MEKYLILYGYTATGGVKLIPEIIEVSNHEEAVKLATKYLQEFIEERGLGLPGKPRIIPERICIPLENISGGRYQEIDFYTP